MEFNSNSVPVPQKENAKTDMRSHNFPQELILPILLLLPVRPLCRFRCISKSFLQLIDSPGFRSRTRFKMVFDEVLPKRKTKSTGFWVCDMDDGSEEKITFTGKVAFAGCCNGLLLLDRGLEHLILWNPSTKKYRNLPACPLSFTDMSDYHNIRLGLGYDSVNDDYKVVSIPKQDGSEAWVFELRSDIWRRIDCEIFPKSIVHEYSVACFAHGSLYWLYRSPITSLKEIAAFDVAKEKFSRVVCPVKSPITGLHVLDECLCISFYSSTAGIKEGYLYVTNKDGDDYIWRKICSVTSEQKLFFDIGGFEDVKVIGYLKEGDKIMMDAGSSFMVSYDLNRNSVEKTDVAGGCQFDRRAIMFTESLVSIGAGRTTKILKPEIKRNEEMLSVGAGRTTKMPKPKTKRNEEMLS